MAAAPQASAPTSCDVVVIGAGHNGLICAAYLAAAGLEVAVVEAAGQVGGNTRTEALTLPGFAHDSCSSAHVLIQSNPLMRDDELELLSTYGLEYVFTDPAVVLPQPDGSALVMHRDLEATAAELAHYSAHDAAAFVGMVREWRDGLAAVHGRVNSGMDPGDTPAAGAYRTLRARSAWEVVHGTFEHPVVRSFMTWLAFATIVDPRRPGTGTLPASIAAGRLSYGWATPMGGSQALPDALVRLIEARGGQVLVGSPVTAIEVVDDRAGTVVTAAGHRLRARQAVVSSAHLAELPGLLRGASAPDDLLHAREVWRPGLSVFAVHAAVRSPLRFGSDRVPATAAGLGGSNGLVDQLDAHERGEPDARDPWLLVVNQSAVDPSRAPDGAGTFKILTVAPYLRNDGRDWSDAKAEYAGQLVEKVRRGAHGLDDSDIVAFRAESPVDVAGHNPHNLGGSCHGGEFVLDGAPRRGWPSYRTGVPGLFLTGSTVHPGGSVSGRPGRNTARAVLTDLGIDPGTVMGPT